MMKLNNHEELFTGLYTRLRGWAIQIVRQDHELAEDLLHDAFIQFTNARPELKKIVNTEAYLYGLIRNLYLSHLRKKARRDKHTSSIIDFETMRLGLKSAEFADNFQIQEELKRICYFLCLRKESSKSASVMILRFFHGYFPSEIASVMRATPQVVKVRLNTARNEARSVIDNPQTITAIEKRISPETVIDKSFRSNVELAVALGKMIFSTVNGICPDDEELNEIYFFKDNETIETKTLAHIVSCRKCIDRVNALLNLLPLSDRYSVDFIGKDNNGPGNPSGNGGGMNEDNEKVLLTLRHRSQEVFEHEPGKLFLSIDGDVRTSRNIEGNTTDLHSALDELPEFIEIYSEHDVCLAFICLAEDSVKFKKSRKFTFGLSDDRKLLVNLEKESSKIIVRASYQNPHFAEQQALAENFAEETPLAEFLRGFDAEAEETRVFDGFLDGWQKSENTFAGRLKNSLFNLKALAAVGALAALLIVALLVTQLFVTSPNVSAAEIIRKTAAAEQTAETDTQKITYRVLNLEEKNAAGTVLKKRRIEIFDDAARKLSVRRLYDESDRLLAGEWRRRDGVSTFYAVGKTSELRLHRTDKDIVDRDSENIWQLSVSAKGFESIAGSLENATLEEQENEYRINYHPAADAKIAKAILYVNRNLRAHKLLLTLRQTPDAPREFSFTEAAFEQKNHEAVEKAAFEPNPEFLKNVLTAGKTIDDADKSDKPSEESEPKTVSPAENSSSAAAATPELEVKVLQLLNNVNALSGEQINIVKTADGKIQIRGIVDAKKRRDEILTGLAEVRGNPSVSVNIQTAEEAAKNKPVKGGDAANLENLTVESRNSIPAGDILRDYFSAQGVADEDIESEIRRYASGALAKSSQVRRAALQMKQIAERFSVAELEKMDEATKNNWRRLIKQNAANLAQNSENLRNTLRGALNIAAVNTSANVDPASDAELIRAAKRLFDLSLFLDRDMRTSFSSGGRGGALPVKSAAFAGNLGELIALAGQLR